MRISNILCLAFVVALMPNFVFAEAEKENSIHGSLGIGFMVIESANNLNPNSSDKRIDSLDEDAESKTSFQPVLLPQISWDLDAPKGLKLYFETDPPIDEVGGFALSLGASYKLDELGILNGGMFASPFEKVWKNPYLTGEDREKTDVFKYGFKVGLNRIMDSGLRVEFVYLNDDVSEDSVESLFPDLARDGNVYALNVNYSIYLNKQFELRPRFSVRKGDYQGEANSFTKYKLGLEARYRTGALTVIPRVNYSHSDYDKVDPVFDKTRSNDGYGVNLIVDYKGPLGFDNWSVTGIAAMNKGNSNIDFYETKSVSVGGMLCYHF